MATPRISFRCPGVLRDRLEREAKRRNVETGELIRHLLGESLSVDVPDLPEGFAALDSETAAEIRSQGGKARAKNRAAEKIPKKARRRKSNAA